MMLILKYFEQVSSLQTHAACKQDLQTLVDSKIK